MTSRYGRICLAVAALLLTGSVARGQPLTLEDVVAGNLSARGGVERWRETRSLRLSGTYAAFSDYEPFSLTRARGDLYRLDFSLLGKPAVRARDAAGVWWQHPLLQPEAARVQEGPYKAMLERESLFGPILLDFAERGLDVELRGESELEGMAVVELLVRFPGGAEERWYLDPQTYLEIASDAQVHDFTQSPEPMRQRTFFDDFREVGGLLLPHRVDLEFGHRLESMTVEKAEVDPGIAEGAFDLPAAATSGD